MGEEQRDEVVEAAYLGHAGFVSPAAQHRDLLAPFGEQGARRLELQRLDLVLRLVVGVRRLDQVEQLVADRTHAGTPFRIPCLPATIADQSTMRSHKRCRVEAKL